MVLIWVLIAKYSALNYVLVNERSYGNLKLRLQQFMEHNGTYLGTMEQKWDIIGKSLEHF